MHATSTAACIIYIYIYTYNIPSSVLVVYTEASTRLYTYSHALARVLRVYNILYCHRAEHIRLSRCTYTRTRGALLFFSPLIANPRFAFIYSVQLIKPDCFLYNLAKNTYLFSLSRYLYISGGKTNIERMRERTRKYIPYCSKKKRTVCLNSQFSIFPLILPRTFFLPIGLSSNSLYPSLPRSFDQFLYARSLSLAPYYTPAPLAAHFSRYLSPALTSDASVAKKCECEERERERAFCVCF